MSARGERFWLNMLLTPAGERLVRATLLANGAIGHRCRSLAEGLINTSGAYAVQCADVSPLTDAVSWEIRLRLFDELDLGADDQKAPWLGPDDLHQREPIGGTRDRCLRIGLRDPADRWRLMALLAGTEAPTPEVLGRALTAMCLIVVLTDEVLLSCWATEFLDELFEETYGPDSEWCDPLDGIHDGVPA